MKKAQYWEDGCGQLGKVAFGATGAKSHITESCRFVYGNDQSGPTQYTKYGLHSKPSLTWLPLRQGSRHSGSGNSLESRLDRDT